MEQPACASASAPASAPAVANYQHAQEGILTGPPVHLARGRQARDPQAKTVSYTVASLDAFETALREYLANPPEHPEHTDCQLSFWIGTSFVVVVAGLASQEAQVSSQVYGGSTGDGNSNGNGNGNGANGQAYGNGNGNGANGQVYSNTNASANGANGIQYGSTYQPLPDPSMALALDFHHPQASPSSASAAPPSTTDAGKNTAHKRSMSILEALQPMPDTRDKMKKQRAIAKCCVDAIQRCDGYRYSFHNCWESREDDSYRFSYYCNDSLLNKDRAANGKGAKLGKRATKPVYDCKGVLSIKFSATKQALDVFYKHVPIHKTYEERAPPPRKDSRRRKFLEEHDPDTLKNLTSRLKPPRPDLPLESAQKAKKKRRTDDQKSSTSLESDLRAQSLRSLLELIRPDPAPEHSPPAPPPPPPPTVLQQRPVPPPPPPPLQSVQQPTQVQHQPQPATRKRPRNSCDVCKVKKTKCDGTRPVCQTCIEKKRQCFYTVDQTPDKRRPSAIPDAVDPSLTHPAQTAPSELSELECMRQELEDAKARIHELEEEKRRASTTPVHTPQMAQQPRPPLQHQSQSQSAESLPQTQTHSNPHPQQAQRDSKHQQQQRQRQHSRSHSTSLHPQQAQQSQKPPKQQQQQYMPTPSPAPHTHSIASPQQAMQQLQTAAQQLQTPHNTHAVNAGHAGHGHGHPSSHGAGAYFGNPYGMSSGSGGVRSAGQAQAQAQGVQQMGVVVGGGGMQGGEASYGRGFAGAGAAAGYYAYQSAAGQGQQGQEGWGGVRGQGVFRQV
ncbi:C6 finger domain-containing protein [Paraphaeosphaeria minitans]|uniref:C6 finger domain-containing protein n=1 Tax=Paraphaeosphaeria minitans TaxID=565426 RepID=A0A9P6GH01_9PLEO|nr:C6 finger domain-containing protein [Paraphaeosphaeria minitans]